MTGATGDTTTTDSRSRRNRASCRGGQLLTRVLGSSFRSACPHLRAPGASVPMVAPYATTVNTAAEHRHRESHTGYRRDWCRRVDLNNRPSPYESAALAAELRRHAKKSRLRANTLWLLDAYRTMCLAPEPAFRRILEDIRELRLGA